ncbi:hypothetical protein PSCICO_10070 [Pseudomonas cichorii]|uniref:Secretion protein HlyD protein n=2 Tax=Pseudomonas syringae group TaxID=136849 RepID=A0A3M4W5I3_PSECI|nr:MULTISPECIES: efflux RND transporter periplasmic adaptor subunit [Pseudomonas]AHF67182.1 secretion protein HlyD family protein [Pseudomonas cichorii JBC1]MDO7925356.1 efflux RND transporter periplasmic adaptor subunit [Pseudomonas sp. KFB-138]QVE19055.1 efflux RND transporter periplasmic adaptor subunit [Pseudomonas cichorii]RMR59193.1 Secretion protein HlyD protein [Pseudomonas cichorii]SDN57353.1 RND family efflux transporter, MFP subunit [Pseudomonas cichorii]
MHAEPASIRQHSRVWLAILISVAANMAHAADTQPVLRVQLSAIAQTTLSSEVAGKITELSIKEGERFKKGDRLVAFDCSVYQAQLNRTAAVQEGARKKLEVANRLDKLNSISVADVTQAQAAMAVARAESGINQAILGRCAITAPFSGRVAARKAQRWEYVAEGKELLSIYDDSAYELELIVPSNWLRWLKPGQNFSVHLDESGKDYPAQISRIGAIIDPVSQSVKVFGRITQSDESLLPGMSGVAKLTAPGES